MAWPYDDFGMSLGGLPSLPQLPQLGSGPAGFMPKQAAIPALQEAERQSLLESLGESALSGLQWVGQSLDKALGGRALRGVLGGRPEELLSLIPFSDTLGISDPSQAVSGEDLLKQWSILEGEGEKGTFELRDLAGPLLEIGLDPATYLSFGASAIGKAGQAAKKAGTLAKSTTGRIAAGQGGLARLGIPFTEIGTEIGTGPIAQKIAGFGESLGDVLAYGRVPGTDFSPGASLSALFDKRVQGSTDPLHQRFLRESADTEAARIAEMREGLIGSMRRISDAGELTPETSSLFRSVMEGKPLGDIGPATQQEVDLFRQMFQQEVPARESALGIPTSPIADYAPRQALELDKATKGFFKPTQPLGAFNVHQLGRDPIFEGMATHEINEAIKAVKALGPDANSFAARDLIASKLGMGSGEWDNLFQLEQLHRAGAMTAEQADELARLRGIRTQSEGFSDWAQRLDPQYGEADYFGRNIYGDIEGRLASGIRSEERAKALHKAVSTAAKPKEAGMIGVDEVFKRAGLTDPQALKQFSELKGIAGSDVFKYGVPAEMADSLTKYVTGFVRPDAMGPVLNAYDSILNLTKAGLTTWPAKYARDLTSNVYMGWLHDVFDPRVTGGQANPLAYVKPYQDAKAIIRDGAQVMPGANKIPGLEGLTEEAATKKLLDEMHARNISGRRKVTAAVEGTGATAKAEAEKMIELPGTPAAGFKEAFMSGTWNPLDIAGVGGRKTTEFKLAKIGSEAVHLIDDVSRGAAYISKRLQGFSPDEAAKVAHRVAYDYSNLSKFEKGTMRRIIPFYNYARQNMPEMFRQLIEQPGGKLGQSIRLTTDFQEQQGDFLPDYLREKLAIPIGTEDATGKQRFLTSFGLPFEEAFQVFGMNPLSPGRSIQKALADTAPFIKGPLELAAGKQFYSGRELGDLYGSTGNPLLDQIIYNSPISRAVTTGRTLLDERKGVGAKALSTLTGAKLTDVDMEKGREIALRDALEERLRGTHGVSQYTNLYVRPENLFGMTPEELQLIQLYREVAKKKRKVGVAK